MVSQHPTFLNIIFPMQTMYILPVFVLPTPMGNHLTCIMGDGHSSIPGFFINNVIVLFDIAQNKMSLSLPFQAFLITLGEELNDDIE